MNHVYSIFNEPGGHALGNTNTYDFTYRQGISSEQEVKAIMKNENTASTKDAVFVVCGILGVCIGLGLAFAAGLAFGYLVAVICLILTIIGIKNIAASSGSDGNGMLDLGYFFVPALQSVVENPRFLAFSGMHMENEMRVLFPKDKVEVYNSTRYVAGTYKGLNFELSLEDCFSSCGGYMERDFGDNYNHIFKGHVVKTELKKELMGSLRIVPKKAGEYFHSDEEQQLQTMNPAFDAMFEVWVTGAGASEMPSIVTNEFMAYLLKEREMGNTYSAVFTGRNAYLAISRGITPKLGNRPNMYDDIVLDATNQAVVEQLSLAFYQRWIAQFLDNTLGVLFTF